MAHEITKNKITGKSEMAYVGETPWHGLGQSLVDGASIDEWKIAAGMDWEALVSSVMYNDGSSLLSMDDKVVVFRGDTKSPLGVVSNQYKIVQPGEVLEFFRDLVDDHGYKMRTAGTLFGGRRIWALAEIGSPVAVGKNDYVGEYLLLSTSLDGSLATVALPTTIRVVCNNTLSMATTRQKLVNAIRVSHRSAFKSESVKAQLAATHDQFKVFTQLAGKLGKVKLSDKQASDFVTTLLKDTKTIFTEDATKTKQYAKIMDLYSGDALGSDLNGTKNTMWGLLNSITEFVDHHAKTKSIDARLNSAWYGRGNDLKTEALVRAAELV